MPGVSRFSGQVPVRFDGAPGGPFAGRTLFRGVKRMEADHLCRVFELPETCYFDLPSTMRGIGPDRAIPSMPGGARRLNGFVMMLGRSEPVGKLSVVFEHSRFKDIDPTSVRDFQDLSHS